MWPVQRGDIPIDNKTGLPKVVNDYKLWRSDLIERIGDYCSYCNIPLSHARQVEHVVAQSLGGGTTDWSNLLLACGPCNNEKSNKPCPPTTHYLPDFHNTHIAFSYVEITFKRKGKTHSACTVVPSSIVPNRAKSISTIKLLELDKLTYEAKAVDRRWDKRYNALLSARASRKLWDSLTSTDQQNNFLENLKTQILNQGFFSLWYTVFEDVPEVRQLIVESVQGTHPNAFPAPNYLPAPLHPPDL